MRKYGCSPFNIAVIHGGPGAAGEMAPVARELSIAHGVLEPIQTASSIEGQLRELHAVLNENGDVPITLVGYSWGAWLSYMFAARHQRMTQKLIIIASGPFEEEYADSTMKTRLSRLSEEEGTEVRSLIKTFEDSRVKNKDKIFNQFGKLLSKADSYDPIPVKSDVIEVRFDIYHRVWKEAATMRRNGELLRIGEAISCPVVAIHGDYDPHPYEGVRIPLSSVIKEFRFILLKKCGHTPWIEKAAKDEFYDLLRKELP